MATARPDSHTADVDPAPASARVPTHEESLPAAPTNLPEPRPRASRSGAARATVRVAIAVVTPILGEARMRASWTASM